MKRFSRIAFLSWMLLGASTAFANQLFNYDFNIGNNTGYGTLDTIDQGGGNYLAVSGSLTVTASSAAADLGNFTLQAGGPGNTYSPAGRFIFNDVLYSLSNPVLDVAGLLFIGNGLEINIFGNGTDTYSFDSWNGSSYNVLDESQIRSSFNLTALPSNVTNVPVPATFALFGLGLLGLAWNKRARS